MKTIPISHGDVNLIPLSKEEWEKISSKAKAVNHKGFYVIALGETTGHKHVITEERPGTMGVFRTDDGRVFITLAVPAKLSHEEHGVLDVPVQTGIYEYIREREKDWFSGVVRRVVD